MNKISKILALCALPLFAACSSNNDTSSTVNNNYKDDEAITFHQHYLETNAVIKNVIIPNLEEYPSYEMGAYFNLTLFKKCSGNIGKYAYSYKIGYLLGGSNFKCSISFDEVETLSLDVRLMKDGKYNYELYNNLDSLEDYYQAVTDRDFDVVINTSVLKDYLSNDEEMTLDVFDSSLREIIYQDLFTHVSFIYNSYQTIKPNLSPEDYLDDGYATYVYSRLDNTPYYQYIHEYLYGVPYYIEE